MRFFRQLYLKPTLIATVYSLGVETVAATATAAGRVIDRFSIPFGVNDPVRVRDRKVAAEP